MDILGLLLQVVIVTLSIALGVVPALVAGVFAKAIISPIAFWPAFALGMLIFLFQFEPLRFLADDKEDNEETGGKSGHR